MSGTNRFLTSTQRIDSLASEKTLLDIDEVLNSGELVVNLASGGGDVNIADVNFTTTQTDNLAVVEQNIDFANAMNVLSTISDVNKGASSANTQRVVIANDQDVLQVQSNSANLATETTTNAIKTAVELIDDTVAEFGTNTYTEANTKGITIGAVRSDTMSSKVTLNNEIAPLQVNSNGSLYVDVLNSGLGLDSGNGTVTDGCIRIATGSDDPNLSALPIIEQTVATLGTTQYLEDTTKGLIIGAVRNDGGGSLVGLDNDIAPLQVDASGALIVDATISTLADASNIQTLGTDTYTETTSKGATIGAVRNNNKTTAVDTNNEFAPLQVNANGELYTTTNDYITNEIFDVQFGEWWDYSIFNGGTGSNYSITNSASKYNITTVNLNSGSDGIFVLSTLKKYKIPNGGYTDFIFCSGNSSITGSNDDNFVGFGIFSDNIPTNKTEMSNLTSPEDAILIGKGNYRTTGTGTSAFGVHLIEYASVYTKTEPMNVIGTSITSSNGTWKIRVYQSNAFCFEIYDSQNDNVWRLLHKDRMDIFNQSGFYVGYISKNELADDTVLRIQEIAVYSSYKTKRVIEPQVKKPEIQLYKVFDADFEDEDITPSNLFNTGIDNDETATPSRTQSNAKTQFQTLTTSPSLINLATLKKYKFPTNGVAEITWHFTEINGDGADSSTFIGAGIFNYIPRLKNDIFLGNKVFEAIYAGVGNPYTGGTAYNNAVYTFGDGNTLDATNEFNVTRGVVFGENKFGISLKLRVIDSNYAEWYINTADGVESEYILFHRHTKLLGTNWNRNESGGFHIGVVAFNNATTDIFFSLKRISYYSSERLEKPPVADMSRALNKMDELIVAELHPQFQYNFSHNINSRIWSTNTNGSATVTYDTRMAKCLTTTASGDRALLTSKIPCHYRNGQEAIARMTAYMNISPDPSAGANEDNSYGCWGLIDSASAGDNPANVIGFGHNDTVGLFIGLKNNNTSGWDQFVKQQDWNGEKLAMTYDPTKLNLFEIRFVYLGALGIEWDIFDSELQRFVKVHKYVSANVLTTPFISNSLLSIGGFCKISSTVSTVADLRIHSVMTGIMGPNLLNHFYPRCISISASTLSSGTDFLVIAGRTTYESKDNFARFFVKQLNCIVSNSGGSGNFSTIRVYKNSTYSAAPSYTDLDTNNSIIETAEGVSVGTVSALGELVYAISLDNNGTISIENLENIYVEPSGTLNFRMFNSSGTSNIDINILVEEDL